MEPVEGMCRRFAPAGSPGRIHLLRDGKCASFEAYLAEDGARVDTLKTHWVWNRMTRPCFVVPHPVECRFLPLIDEGLTEQDLPSVLTQKRLEEIKRPLDRVRGREVVLGWASLLSFSEMLCFVWHFALFPLPVRQHDLPSATRNRIAHVRKSLVTKHEDGRLVQVRDACGRLLAAACPGHDWSLQRR